MKRGICSRRWKARKLNNRGSSLALVTMIVSIVAILGVVILSTSLATYKMKETYLKSQKTFYSAESVVDAIRVGLQQEVSNAAGYAYSWVLEHYGDSDESARNQQYVQKFEDKLVSSLVQPGSVGSTARLYDVKKLEAMVPEAMKASALNYGETSTLPIVWAWKDTPFLNHDADRGSYTIKNLWVRYIDENNYLTEIRTDIVINIPKIDFSQKSSEPQDLTNYAFVACTQTYAKGVRGTGADGCMEVNGNAYLGDNGAVFDDARVLFTPAVSGAKLITGGTLLSKNISQVNIAGAGGNVYSIWADTIKADAASLNIDGVTYLSNDLVLENGNRTSVTVNLNGRLYAFGNPNSALTADAFLWDVSAGSDYSKLWQYPADYSSAILINGRNATLDMSGLEDLVIAGNAYVAANQKNDNSGKVTVNPGTPDEWENENTGVQMGESVTLKSSQRAYLAPANLVGRGSEYGGRNPMLYDDYKKLNDDICEIYGFKKANGKPDWDRIKNNTNIYLYGGPGEVQELPYELAGVRGIQTQFYRVLTSSNKSVVMVYLFLKFDNEADAIRFSASHYAEDKELSALRQVVDTNHYNTKIDYPDEMRTELANPADLISNFRFYYNGNVLVPEGANTRFVSGKCTKLSSLASVNLASKERSYQNTFFALKHCLNQDFSMLTLEQKQNNIYVNLVDMSGGTKGIPVTEGMTAKLFSTGTSGVATASQMCAVVVNNRDYTYTLTGSGDDAIGPDGLPLHLVIASGDVEVNCNFRGLIIAGGKVSFGAGCKKIAADSNMAQQALKIENADGTRPVDYLVNGENYIVDGNGAGSGGEPLNYADYVVYHNWVKQ